MSTWTSDELDKIGTADELEIAPLRSDGTLRNPVTIWVVRQGDNLYVRSYKGRGGSWFRAAQSRNEGRIRTGGVEKNVIFVEETDARHQRPDRHRLPHEVPPLQRQLRHYDG
jgi:hypothetical protein